MSDTEEVVLTRTKTKVIKDTKPEIAREKLKAKRERLKKEKEDFIIEEAKKRLAEEQVKKQHDEIKAKEQEEEKKKSDPMFQMMLKMEQMIMAMPNMINKPTLAEQEKPVEPKKRKAPANQRSPVAKKIIFPEPEIESEEEVKVTRKAQPANGKKKEVVDKPNPSKGLPKPRKKVVHLQSEPVLEESTQFVGYDVAPPAQPVQYQSNGLLNAMMSRRNMNVSNQMLY